MAREGLAEWVTSEPILQEGKGQKPKSGGRDSWAEGPVSTEAHGNQGACFLRATGRSVRRKSKEEAY